MIWHPLPIAVLLSDAIGILMILSAAPAAMTVIASWNPGSAQRGQIALEQRTESASIQARFGLWVLTLSSVLLVVAIANILADLVPGAMCGTGVLQAMGDKGQRALGFRLLGLGILYAWHVIDRLNRQQPQAPLTEMAARVLLLALPFLVLAYVDTLGAFLHLNVAGPVNCCASVYNRFSSVTDATRTAGLTDVGWIWLLGLLSLALLVSTAACTRSQQNSIRSGAGWVTVISLVWVPVATTTLVRVLAAYHYEVLHHHCPWCLFLPDHRFIGFLFLGALTLVLYEGGIVSLTAGISRRFSSVQKQAHLRCAAACRRVLLAVCMFTAAAGLPAIVWRLRFGVWMG